MRPNVQSVEQIISDLNPAYQGSIDVIKQQQAQLPGQFQAQRMGLDAQKVQGFNQINNQATGRGLSFSGIPLDEQSNYLSTQYLPGMQRLAEQENTQRLALTSSLAEIDKERRLRAMDIRQGQQTSLEKYLAEERQMAWERERFAAEQAMERQKMAQQAAQAAAGRASDGGSAYDAIEAFLQANKGTDNKVSPTVWAQAISQANRMGIKYQGANGFATQFWGYANNNHWWDYRNDRFNN